MGKADKNGKKVKMIKVLPFSVKAIDDVEGIVSGYASTFENIDLGDDVIHRGAFKKTIGERVNKGEIKAYYNHAVMQSMPIGVIVEAKEDEIGLFVKMKLILDDVGQKLMMRLKAVPPVLDRFSIGFEPIVQDWDADGIRHIREIKLHEVSIVDYPMNPAARVISVKGFVGDDDLQIAMETMEFDNKPSNLLKAFDIAFNKVMNEQIEENQKYGRMRQIASSFAEHVNDWAETAMLAGMFGSKAVTPPTVHPEPVETTPELAGAGFEASEIEEIMGIINKIKKGDI